MKRKIIPFPYFHGRTLQWTAILLLMFLSSFHFSITKNIQNDCLNIWFELQQNSKKFSGTFNSSNIYETISLLDSFSSNGISVSDKRTFGRMLYEIENSLVLDDILIEKVITSGDDHLIISALEFKFRTIIEAQKAFNSIFRRMTNDNRLANLVLFSTCNYECTGTKTKILKYFLGLYENSKSHKRWWLAVERMLSGIDFKRSETNEHGLQASAYGIFLKPSDVLVYLSQLSSNEADIEIKSLSEQSISKIKVEGRKEKFLEGEDDLIRMHSTDKTKYDQAVLISDLLQQVNAAESDEEKILLYSKIVSIDSTIFTAYINRGVSYYKMDEWEKALSDFDISIKFNNETGIPYAYKGVILYKAGDVQNALNNLNKAIELDPYLEIAYSYRGIALQNNGKFEQAIGDFTVAIEMDSSVISNYINRGICYATMQKLVEAEVDLKEAVKRSPESAEAFYNLGTVYYLQKNWNSAAANWKKCIELDNRFKDIPEKLEHIKQKIDDKIVQ